MIISHNVGRHSEIAQFTFFDDPKKDTRKKCMGSGATSGSYLPGTGDTIIKKVVPPR